MPPLRTRLLCWLSTIARAPIFATFVIGCPSSSHSGDASRGDSSDRASDLRLAGVEDRRSLQDRWSACHPFSSTGPGRPLDTLPGSTTAVSESYHLKSIGGRELPIVVTAGPNVDTTYRAQSITLLTDGTYRSAAKYQFRRGRSLTTKEYTDTGRYRRDSNVVVIVGQTRLCSVLERTEGGQVLRGGEEIPNHPGVGVGRDFVYTLDR